MRTRIDWDEVFRWLESGYLASDIAMMHGLARDTISMRARRDLSPERHALWKQYNSRNRGMLLKHDVECGTQEGYMRHYKSGEPACGPCKAAHSVYTNELSKARRAKRPKRQYAPHGTPAAHRRHYRKGEKPCEECRQAHIKDCKERRAEKKEAKQ